MKVNYTVSFHISCNMDKIKDKTIQLQHIGGNRKYGIANCRNTRGLGRVSYINYIENLNNSLQEKCY